MQGGRTQDAAIPCRSISVKHYLNAVDGEIVDW